MYDSISSFNKGFIYKLEFISNIIIYSVESYLIDIKTNQMIVNT